jgi:drug/metabolite transporter (DMT)-like permease
VGYFYAFLAAFLFGANGSVTKVMIEAGLTALQVTQIRVLGAAVVAGLVLFMLDRRSFRVPRGQRAALIVMGVIGVGLLQASYALAVELLPVGIALLLEYLAVPMVAVFAFFVFKERVRTRIWVSIGLIMAGLAVVAQIWDSSLNLIGTLWALVAALSLSTYFLVGEKQMETISPLALMFWSMSIAAVAWAFISGWWRIDSAVFSSSVPLTGVLEGVPAPMWLLMVWNVVMGSFAPFLLSLAAIKKLSATAAGIAATSEIVFAFIVAWLWLQENLDATQILGAGVVLGGIILAQTARRSQVPIQADLALETGPIVLPDITEWEAQEQRQAEGTQ